MAAAKKTTATVEATSQGRIAQIIGAVVDV